MNLVECPKCGWVHFSVDEKHVSDWEAEWKELFETKPKEWLAAYGVTDAPPSRDQYLRCFRCGNKEVKDFFPTKKSLNGNTLQPVLWEPTKKL